MLVCDPWDSDSLVHGYVRQQLKKEFPWVVGQLIVCSYTCWNQWVLPQNDLAAASRSGEHFGLGTISVGEIEFHFALKQEQDPDQPDDALFAGTFYLHAHTPDHIAHWGVLVASHVNVLDSNGGLELEVDEILTKYHRVKKGDGLTLPLEHVQVEEDDCRTVICCWIDVKQIKYDQDDELEDREPRVDFDDLPTWNATATFDWRIEDEDLKCIGQNYQTHHVCLTSPLMDGGRWACRLMNDIDEDADTDANLLFNVQPGFTPLKVWDFEIQVTLHYDINDKHHEHVFVCENNYSVLRIEWKKHRLSFAAKDIKDLESLRLYGTLKVVSLWTHEGRKKIEKKDWTSVCRREEDVDCGENGNAAVPLRRSARLATKRRQTQK